MYALNRSERFGTVRTSAPPCCNPSRQCSAEPPRSRRSKACQSSRCPPVRTLAICHATRFRKSNACAFASYTFPHPRQRTSTPTQPPAMTRAEPLCLALVHHVHRFTHFPQCIFSQRAHGGIAVMQHIEHVVTLLRKLGTALSIRLQKAVHTLRNVCFQRA